ncbi:MAG: hypothetical protein GVY20_05515 [Bacteroidetes bacterium]|nr:hypothetical protein [Bacteroidota bacterium]
MNSIKHRAVTDASQNIVGDPDLHRESHFLASERFCPKDRTDAGGRENYPWTTYRMPSLYWEPSASVFNIPTLYGKTL